MREQGQKIKTLKSGIVLSVPTELTTNSQKPNTRQSSYKQDPPPRRPYQGGRSSGGAPPRSAVQSRPRRPSHDPGHAAGPTDRQDSPPGLTASVPDRKKVEPLKRLGSAKAAESSNADEEMLKKLQALQLDKEKADDRSRQMELQTVALMEERAKIQAEKTALEVRHNVVLAKVELLESLHHSPDQDHSDDESGEVVPWADAPV